MKTPALVPTVLRVDCLVSIVLRTYKPCSTQTGLRIGMLMQPTVHVPEVQVPGSSPSGGSARVCTNRLTPTPLLDGHSKQMPNIGQRFPSSYLFGSDAGRNRGQDKNVRLYFESVRNLALAFQFQLLAFSVRKLVGLPNMVASTPDCLNFILWGKNKEFGL